MFQLLIGPIGIEILDRGLKTRPAILLIGPIGIEIVAGHNAFRPVKHF